MKHLIYIFLLTFIVGCTSTIKKLQTKQSMSKPEVVKFEEVDTDSSGAISEKEFKAAKKSNIVYNEPLWAFYGILVLVAALLTVSNFLQRKRNNDV